MGQCLAELLTSPAGPIIELEAGNNVECCVAERAHSSPYLTVAPPSRESDASILIVAPERFDQDISPIVKD